MEIFTKLLIVTVHILLNTTIIYCGWSMVMPSLGLPELTFYQALGLHILADGLLNRIKVVGENV